MIMKTCLLLVTLLALTSKADAALPVDDTNALVAATTETNGVRFTAYTTNNSFKVGSPIAITTVVKNISSNNLEVVIAGILSEHTVRVFQQGKEVEMTKSGRENKMNSLSSFVKELKLGQQIVEPLPVSRYYDLTNAGDYEFVISRYVGPWVITAPPLKITLVGHK